MTRVTSGGGLSEGHSRKDEFALVAILCAAWGLVNVDMFGINYLMPFIQPSLRLSNTQVGLLVSASWITFAISSCVAGAVTDKVGKRKSLLFGTLLLFAIASVLPGLATSFAVLLGARLLTGFLEGPVLPIAQSIVALESPVARRGLNMGIVQTLGSSLLLAFAPVLLVRLAMRYEWRAGFFVVVLPCLVCAGLVARYLREATTRCTAVPGSAEAVAPELQAGLKEILRVPNIWLCAAGACFFVAYLTVGLGFLPLFYVKVRSLRPQDMSILMGALGISSMVFGVALPAISDRIGRKRVVICASLLGMLCPLAAMYYPGPVSILAILVFFGWTPSGASTLLFSTIPCESVPGRSISTAIGLIIAISTLCGGVIGPTLAGWSADHWGLWAPMWQTTACCAAIAVIATALQETAPNKRKKILLTMNRLTRG